MKNTLNLPLKKILIIVLVLGLGFSIQQFLHSNTQTEGKTINKAGLVVGGYSTERNLTADDQRVFDQVLQSAAAVKYTPLKVSTQVVAGTNYKFYTKAKTTTPEQKTSYVYIYVFKPLGEDKPILTKIEPVQ